MTNTADMAAVVTLACVAGVAAFVVGFLPYELSVLYLLSVVALASVGGPV